MFTSSTAVNTGEFWIFSDVHCHLKKMFSTTKVRGNFYGYFPFGSWEIEKHRQIDRQTDRQTDRQIDRRFCLCSIDCYIIRTLE